MMTIKTRNSIYDVTLDTAGFKVVKKTALKANSAYIKEGEEIRFRKLTIDIDGCAWFDDIRTSKISLIMTV